VSKIRDHFHEYSPRPQQERAMQFLGENWDKADVFVLQLPVAVGKSNLGMALARWASKEHKKKSIILVPTNVLLQQYKDSFKRLHFLQRKDLYRCKRFADRPEIPLQDANCDYMREVFGQGCEGCCYTTAVRKAHAVPYMVCNYWTFMAHKLHRPVVIADEAHNIINIIRDLEGKRLWQKDYSYPTTITTYGDLLRWVEKHPRRDTDPKLQTLYTELSEGRQHYLIESGVDLYRGREEACLKLLPIDVRNAKPYLWPKRVEKIILMSATFTRVDLEMLGLMGRRVAIMETGSPIPPERRPVHFLPIVNSSFQFQDAAIPKLAAFLQELADSRTGTRGFVHTTYGMAAKLARHLAGDGRFIFHDSETKIPLYEAGRNSPPGENKVFVGCGMEEGIDLKGSSFGWQVLTKAQYASLSEPAIRFQAETRAQEYTWDAMRKCAQSCGRICRDPGDYGETFLVDKTFRRLFRQSDVFGIIPTWLREQLTNEKELLE